MLAIALTIAAAMALGACPKPEDGSTADPQRPVLDEGTPGDGAPAHGDGVAQDSVAQGGEGDEGAPAAEGCASDADCGGGVCEGEGCGEVLGTCAPADRMCTRDARPYCGCDGETFISSGSCPGRRYAHRGPCES